MTKEELISIVSKSYSSFRAEDVVKISDLGNEQKKINIIVATSGDTGAAAIDALKGKKNLNVFVLPVSYTHLTLPTKA